MIAVSRPKSNFNGVIGCWRAVTGLHTYKRRTAYRGQVFKPGDTRRVDVTMDSEKWLQMLRDDVIPAMKAKAPATQYVQWDNAAPASAQNKREIANLLEQNGLVQVPQCPTHPTRMPWI